MSYASIFAALAVTCSLTAIGVAIGLVGAIVITAVLGWSSLGRRLVESIGFVLFVAPVLGYVLLATAYFRNQLALAVLLAAVPVAGTTSVLLIQALRDADLARSGYQFVFRASHFRRFCRYDAAFAIAACASGL